jgi:hypothetical protein
VSLLPACVSLLPRDSSGVAPASKTMGVGESIFHHDSGSVFSVVARLRFRPVVRVPSDLGILNLANERSESPRERSGDLGAPASERVRGEWRGRSPPA